MTDIYAIETKMKSVVDFLEQKLDEGTKVYKPTRIRLEGLLNQCNTAIDLITQILEEGILEDDLEFENNEETFTEIFNELYRVTNKFESFLGRPVDLDIPQELIQQDTNKVQKSSIDRKQVLSEYKTSIATLVDNIEDFEIECVRECAYIIQQWFDARYKKGVSDFKYDVRSIPRWILGIVVSYCASIRNDGVQKFTLDFFDWIDRVDNDPKYSCYPLPYNIYKNSTIITDDSASLLAIVMWDILYDNGLKDLCGCQVAIQKIQMKNLFGSAKLSDTKIKELKRHRDYLKYDDILKEVGLVDGEDGDENV